MFATRTRRTTLTLILALVLAASAWAEDSAAPAAKDAAAPAAAPAQTCPNSETGACCATCREQAAQAKEAEGGAHECPCKRARAKAAQQGS